MGSLKAVPEKKDPYRVGTVIYPVTEPYLYNGDFDVIRGHQYFREGVLDFGNEKVDFEDGDYRTKFGGVAHSGEILANNDINMRYAMWRLTGCRLSDAEKDAIKQGQVVQPNYHNQLFANQADSYITHKEFFARVSELYAPHFEEYTDSETEAIEHAADPHPKQLLRIQALQELRESGRLHDPEDTWCNKTVWWKLKRREWKKPGKKGRGIGDLGVAASLRGFRLTNFLKTAQADTIVNYKGGKMMFCKSPDPFALKAAFEELIEPSGRFFFLYFSDDSCLSIRVGGEIWRYNLDISSCDASHGPTIFETLVDVVPERCKHDMRLLVRQCQTPLRVDSTNKYGKKKKLVLRPKRPMLFSGSTITTAINNIANLKICVAIADAVITCDADIERAALSVGYILTGTRRLERIEDIQFLKHSPVLDTNGRYQPMLNLGVLLRASCTCQGDLPGSGPIIDRASAFQRGLLQGAYPHTKFRVIDAMRKAVGQGPVTLYDWTDKIVVNPDFNTYTAQDSSIYARYRLTPIEIAELEMDFASMPIFYEYSGSSIDKILTVDYGLTSISTVNAGFTAACA